MNDIEVMKKELELLKKENKYLRQELGRNEMRRAFPETTTVKFPNLKGIMWRDGGGGYPHISEKYRTLISELIRRVISDSKNYGLQQLQNFSEQEYEIYLETFDKVLQSLSDCAIKCKEVQ